MKAIALLIVLATLAIGTYLSKTKTNDTASTLVEDTVGSQMAAPQKIQENTTDHHPTIPL